MNIHFNCNWAIKHINYQLGLQLNFHSNFRSNFQSIIKKLMESKPAKSQK
jgi:hypothetical protein